MAVDAFGRRHGDRPLLGRPSTSLTVAAWVTLCLGLMLPARPVDAACDADHTAQGCCAGSVLRICTIQGENVDLECNTKPPNPVYGAYYCGHDKTTASTMGCYTGDMIDYKPATGNVWCPGFCQYGCTGPTCPGNCGATQSCDNGTCKEIPCGRQTYLRPNYANYLGQGKPATTVGLVAVCTSPVDNWSMAVRKDGTLVGWGDNGGVINHANVASIKDAVQVACTQGGVAVVRADRTVVTWGGPGAPAVLQNAATAKVVQIAASEEAFAVVREDSSILIWGGDIAGKHGILNGKTGFKAVGGGEGGFIGIKLDGTLVQAARDGSQLDNTFLPPPSGLTGVVQATLADGIAAALKSDGKVVTWGSGNPGVPGDLKPIVSLGVGHYGDTTAVLAVQVDGKMRAWGRYYNPDTGGWSGGVPKVMGDAIAAVSGVFAVDPHGGAMLNCLGSCGAVSAQGCCDGDKAYRCNDKGERVAQTCNASTCGWASSASEYQCSTTGAAAPGLPLQACVCVPDCTGKQCGSDGCGGSCDKGSCEDGNGCTINDKCQGENCVGGGAYDCDDSNPCTDDACTSKDGKASCSHTANTATCDDGSACTVGDVCAGSSCTAGKQALDCDDGNVCTDDGCAPKTGCSHTGNTAGCSDGDACTLKDTCKDGKCAITSTGCASANDGQTLTLSCNAGTIVGIAAATYGALTAACPSPKPGGCSKDAVAYLLAQCKGKKSCATTAWHTVLGDPCPGQGKTIAAVFDCRDPAAAPQLACDDGNPCTNDTCDPAKGCQYAPNTAPCDDASTCTANDVCSNGKCGGKSNVDCDDNNPCTIDDCSNADTCAPKKNVQNGTICSDGNACHVPGACSAGSCAGITDVNCDDGNVCTNDGCDPKTGCSHTANTAPCSDNDACTVADTCAASSCKSGSPLACGDGNPCTDDVCDSKSGCKNVPLTSTAQSPAPCDDGSVCTLGDACAAGKCKGGPAKDCEDGEICTADSCNPLLGCAHADSTAPCDDGNPCTKGDACWQGACVGGAAPGCNDGNPCTDDSCDATKGCQNTPNSHPCNDGDPCTVNDACANGGCQKGKDPLNCDDGNVCTDDGCFVGKGCSHTPNGKPCDDGDGCTVSDVCSGGTCGGKPKPCDDGDACTDDVCVAGQGCTSKPNTAPCTDGNPCTDGTCVPGKGCVTTPNSASCDDGNLCTLNDSCVAGACQGGSVKPCDDGNPCTSDHCAPVGAGADGCWHGFYQSQWVGCDDGNACTVNDRCVDGKCKPGPSACLNATCTTASGKPDCACPANFKAVDYPESKSIRMCCQPQCTGKSCGPDGCGGECPNLCKDTELCNADWGYKCAPKVACYGKAPMGAGCCDGDKLSRCFFPNNLNSWDCSKEGKTCGWSETGGEYACVDFRLADPSGKSPYLCPGATCTPDCNGRECGPDGCGGMCGSCSGKLQCDMAAGKCLDPCEGLATLTGCVQGKVGDQEVLARCPKVTAKGKDVEQIVCPADKPVGWYKAWKRFICGGTDTPPAGVAKTCDLPKCFCGQGVLARTCGDDNCGGSCGSCSSPTVCYQDNCCTPSCDGKTCGPDGCGGSCGSCGAGQQCTSGGTCAVPECADMPNPGGACTLGSASGGKNVLEYCGSNAKISVDCGAIGGMCRWNSPVPTCAPRMAGFAGAGDYKGFYLSSCAGRPGKYRCSQYFGGGNICDCDAGCEQRGDCCADYVATCAGEHHKVSCGDGTCSGDGGETCETCPGDCGACADKTTPTGPWALPYQTAIDHAGQPNAKAVRTIRPLDDVRPQTPPVSREGLLAWLPGIDAAQTAPGTRVRLHKPTVGDGPVAVASGTQDSGISFVDANGKSRGGHITILPDAMLPRPPSFAARRVGGVTVAGWVRLSPDAADRPNTLGSGRTAWDVDRYHCAWSRPQSSEVPVDCGSNNKILAIRAYYGEVQHPRYPPAPEIASNNLDQPSCSLLAQMDPTWRCHADGVQALAEKACVGKQSCWVNPWGMAADPCSAPPHKPIKSTLMVQAVCGPMPMDAAAALVVGDKKAGRKLQLIAPGMPTLTSQAAVPVGTWTHVAVTFESHGLSDAGTVRLYIDGQPQAVQQGYRFPRFFEWDWGLGPATGAVPAWDGYIDPGGNAEAANLAGHFDLDDAVLYDRALTPTELSAWIASRGIGVTRIWPPIEADRVEAANLWAEGGTAKAVAVTTPQIVDPVTGAAIEADFRGITVPGGNVALPADGSDIAGLTNYALVGWVRVDALAADATLLELQAGTTSAWRLTSSGCDNGGLRLQSHGGATIASSSCVHRLQAGAWAFVAYVQSAGQGSLYLDGALLGSGAAPGALLPQGSATATLRTGKGVALGWATLLRRVPSRDDLESLRSQGPAVWLDGTLVKASGAAVALPRDFAGFVHAGDGGRARAYDGNWNEAVNPGNAANAVIAVPENGRFRGGAATAWTWAGTVRLPQGSASMPLLRHAVDGKVQRRLRLECSDSGKANVALCSLTLATGFSYGSLASATRWNSAPFEVSSDAKIVELRVAVAFDGATPRAAFTARDAAGLVPVLTRIGAEQRDGSQARQAWMYKQAVPVSEPKTPALELPGNRSGLLFDAALTTGQGLRDNRLYPRALGDAELGRLATQDCAGQNCSALNRACSVPSAGAANAMASVGSLAACGGCASGYYDDAGVCLAKATFRGGCAYHSACQSGYCVGGYCRSTSADASCKAHCLKLGRDCVAVDGGGFECGNTCLPNFSMTAYAKDPISGLYGPTCAWAPKVAVGDACGDSQSCDSSLCASQTTTAYHVSNTNTKLQTPRYPNPVAAPYKATPTGPWETCSSVDQCAKPDPYTKTLNVCAAKTKQDCSGRAMDARLVKGTGWDGQEHVGYICEGCLKDTYQGGPGDPNNGKPLYVQGWSMLSPDACRKVYENYFKQLNNGTIKVGDSTYNTNKDGWGDSIEVAQMGDILAHPPKVARLRKLLLNDSNPASTPTPAILSQLEVAGVGRAFLDPAYKTWKYDQYLTTKNYSSGGRPEQLRLGACAMESYKATNYEGWEFASNAKSLFFDQTRNRPVCVENKFPNGSPCPPGGTTKTYTRANAGLFCASGFCAADSKVCETGFKSYEETNGRARNDGNDGGADNDLGAIALVQDNGSAFRFDKVDSSKVKLASGTTDNRHILLESHSKNTLHLFGWSTDLLDMSVTLLESPGAADTAVKANVTQQMLVCGLQLPSLPKLPKAKCGAVQFENGEYKAPKCKAEKTSVGVSVKHNEQSKSGGKTFDNEQSVHVTDGALVPTITYNIPLPLQECPDDLDGFKLVVGRACFAKQTAVGPVPFKVEAKVEPVASVSFGVELDSDTFEPAAKISPSVGLALEVKGGVGGKVGPLELFAGLKGVITIIEAALPVTFGLSFVQVSANGSPITDLWEVRKVITGRFELNFLKLALSVFFEVGVGPIKVELEYNFFQWDGIGLSWKLGEVVAERYKVDFQWDSYATSTSSGHGGGQ